MHRGQEWTVFSRQRKASVLWFHLVSCVLVFSAPYYRFENYQKYFYLTRFFVVLYLTIIPRTRVGYELLDSGWGAEPRGGYHKLISKKREWNNCLLNSWIRISRISIFFSLPSRVFGHFEAKFSAIKLSVSTFWQTTGYRIYTVSREPIRLPEIQYPMFGI